MDLVNFIFEKYGGKEIVGIFQKILTLALLLKQLVFSFFVVPADQPAARLIPEESSHTISQTIQTETVVEDLNRFQVLQLMLTLAQLEMEQGVLSSEDIIQK